MIAYNHCYSILTYFNSLLLLDELSSHSCDIYVKIILQNSWDNRKKYIMCAFCIELQEISFIFIFILKILFKHYLYK